jgi:hypothetical protein
LSVPSVSSALAERLEGILLCRCILGRPLEVSFVAPHAMENERQLAGHGGLGFIEADAF